MSAQSFNKARIKQGVITPDHVTTLVREYQAAHPPLLVDGFCGDETIRMLNGDTKPRVDPLSIDRVWPLPGFGDERQPQITSGHSSENPDRPNHHGCDLFYAYDPKVDPPVKVGDGGAAGDRKGKPKWWIPEGTPALASADGTVVLAGNTPTGIRVWIEHAPGVYTGYFHLRTSPVEIAPGYKITAGEVVGTVGDNPSDRDAAHLHFEVYVGDLSAYPAGSVNPRPWLEGATQI